MSGEQADKRAAALTATVETTVPFHDCDPLFVVWHGRYFEYMELARTALLKSLELDVPHIRDMGYRMYVTDVRCRYLFPMRYDDRVRITAKLLEDSPLLKFSYQLYNVTAGRKIARATTTLATTDAHGALLTETPAPIQERLTRGAGGAS